MAGVYIYIFLIFSVFCLVQPFTSRLATQFGIHSPKTVSGHFADFLYKTTFLKSKFEDDPVRVQKRNLSHFKGLE